MSFFYIQENQLRRTVAAPKQHQLLVENPQLLLPPMITALHDSFRAWGDAQRSPGPVLPERFWIAPHGGLAVEYLGETRPGALMQVGPAPDLAAWMVLLDLYMETYVVIARARSVWSVNELAGALGFLTPAYLPPSLMERASDTWDRVASALSMALADGALAGAPMDRHWRE